MTEKAPNSMPGRKKNRETILLVIVAAVGLLGLIALQLVRKGPADNANKTLVQTDAQSQMVDQQAVKAVQRVPGELIRTSEHPEAGKPFKFRMAKHAQGAVYELEFSGGKRKAFDDKGELTHTFYQPGHVMVTLYARFEGEEARLDTLNRIVARRAEKIEVAPIIDY
ncbi:MAG: hypothetical protein IT269_05355 [Saprospiraceae bacterium]|nr:hypothetical protein [Saprospiraceae bacterium]